jgi:hypothetical protein
MKAKLVLDQGCNPQSAPAYLRDAIQFRVRSDGKRSAFYPKGTEFKGDQAVQLCRTGQATPSDEECAASVGISKIKLDNIQKNYEMESKGLVTDEDKELYLTGVITGFKNGEYIQGPRWQEYQDMISDESDELEGI